MASIQVKSKISGKTGTLPSEKYDPSKYELVDPSQASALGPEHIPVGGDMSVPPERNRPLGGMIPTVTGTVGEVVGSVLGPVGRRAGTYGGTGTGVAIEDALMLLSGQNQSPDERLNRFTGEVGTQLATNELGNIASKVLQKVLPFLGKQGIKMALPETGKDAAENFGREAVGKGQELATGIMDRGITGTPEKLVQLADKTKRTLSARINDIVGTLNKTNLDEVTDLVPTGTQGGSGRTGFNILEDAGKEPLNKAQRFIADILQETQTKLAKTGGFGSMSDVKEASKIMADIWDYQKLRAANGGWQAVADLKDVGNFLGRGEAANTQTAIARKVYSELSSSLNAKIRQEIPELAEPFTEYGFYNRLLDAAKTKGGKALFTRGDIIPLLIGGGLGAGTGIATGNPLAGILASIASVGAAKLPFSPLLTTNLGKILKTVSRAAPAAGPAAQFIGGGIKQLGEE